MWDTIDDWSVLYCFSFAACLSDNQMYRYCNETLYVDYYTMVFLRVQSVGLSHINDHDNYCFFFYRDPPASDLPGALHALVFPSPSDACQASYVLTGWPFYWSRIIFNEWSKLSGNINRYVGNFNNCWQHNVFPLIKLALKITHSR